jgi:hypothetical protein
MDISGTIAATSAPRDGQVLFWSVDTGGCLGHVAAADACGVAAADQPGHFFITTGEGHLTKLAVRNDDIVLCFTKSARVQWDNHVYFV